MQLTGNTILITGGGSGIGRGLAEAFAARGNDVIIAGRRESVLQDVAKQHPKLRYLGLDVADPKAIEPFVENMLRQYPRVNVLVNNAGIMRTEDWAGETISTAVAEETIAINLVGLLRLTAAMLPALRKQPAATVMNVSSGLAFVPLAQTPVYCATKAAVHSYTQSLRYQLRATKVEVLELIPPYVQTDLLDGKNDPAAMPLEAFIEEVLQQLGETPTPPEIAVERVNFLRLADSQNRYQQTLQQMNAARDQPKSTHS